MPRRSSNCAGCGNKLVGAMDELRGKLKAADREHNTVVRLSEEREEQERAAQGNLVSKILLLFPSDCQFLGRGVF
jgi:hypothetical protein